MQDILPFFVFLPLLAFFVALLLPAKTERMISGWAIGLVGAQLVGLLAFAGIWLKNGAPATELKHWTLYQTPDFEFFLDYVFDRTTAVFAIVGAILTLLVAIFSQTYMHRDGGFKRFFCTLLLFFTGYNFVVFGGNFETLFVGWEVLGITSFLLIAFYRDRYLPVKNAYKVLSFYRLGDICLILAMWMSHHLWHKNITFMEMSDSTAVADLFATHFPKAIFVAAMIVLAAIIKSAQMPFSTWLPRAMEGPTTSSAIFYGSLAVHIGAFLLLRTYGFWENQAILQWAVVGVGLLTSLLATSISQVQSTVKTQIAYSSIAQIGLIFIEIGLGWHTLALIHFAGNAFLRTYQLLVSPSVLSYLVHDMFFHFKPAPTIEGNGFFEKMRQAQYILSVREWNLDHLLNRILWRPFKWIGSKMNFLMKNGGLTVHVIVVLAAFGAKFFTFTSGQNLAGFFPVLFSGLGLLAVLQAFSGRGEAMKNWGFAVASQYLVAAAVLAMSPAISPLQIVFYLCGMLAAGLVGYLLLQKLRSLEGPSPLDRYHGHSYEHPGLGLGFLICCLAFAGFPITPTFVGIDLIFTHIHESQVVLVAILALNYLFLELALIRIFCRVFLGPHKKAYHPIAFKSS